MASLRIYYGIWFDIGALILTLMYYPDGLAGGRSLTKYDSSAGVPRIKSQTRSKGSEVILATMEIVLSDLHARSLTDVEKDLNKKDAFYDEPDRVI